MLTGFIERIKRQALELLAAYLTQLVGELLRRDGAQIINLLGQTTANSYRLS
jgi:hypothetical protein